MIVVLPLSGGTGVVFRNIIMEINAPLNPTARASFQSSARIGTPTEAAPAVPMTARTELANPDMADESNVFSHLSHVFGSVNIRLALVLVFANGVHVIKVLLVANLHQFFR